MAYAVTNNSPSAGYIAWTNLHVQFDGSNYTIADGNTNKKYSYWTQGTPTSLVCTDTFPTLGNNDCLIFLNKFGIATVVPTATALPGDLVVPGTITADQLAANCVTAVKINAGAVTTDALNAGSVTTEKLSAGAVTADKMFITDMTNYIEDPDFERDEVGSTPKGFNSSSRARVVDISSMSNGSNRALELDALNGSFSEIWMLTSNLVPVKSGDKFYVSFQYRFLNTAGTTGVLRLLSRYYNAAKIGQSSWPSVSTSTTKTTTWTRIEGQITAPGDGYLQFGYHFSDNGETTNKGYIDNVIVRKKSNGELLVDGEITAIKLNVAEIFANALLANAIKTGNLDAQCVTAAKINVGDLIASTAFITALKAQGIEVGANGATVYVKIEDGQVSIVDSGVAVAYFNDQLLHIRNAEILEALGFGPASFVTTSTGFYVK
jgi:hypothetical protein